MDPVKKTIALGVRIKHRLGPFWWHSALLFVASRIGDVIQMVIGVFLVPLYVAGDQLGAVLPLLSLGSFLSVPLTASARTAGRFITGFRVSGEQGRIRALLRDLMRLASLVSIVGAAVVLGGRSFLADRLLFEGWVIPLLVVGLIAVSCWQPVIDSGLQGLGQYYRITSSALLGGLVRLPLALVLLPLWGLEGFLGLQLLGSLIVALFLLRGFRAYFSQTLAVVSNRSMLKEVWRFFLPMLAMTGAFAFQGVMEPWIIRHRLPAEESAAFYLTSRFGLIPSYLASAFSVFLFPMVSERHDRGETTRGLRLQVLGSMAAVGGVMTILLAVFGEPLLNAFSAWRPYLPYASLLWKTSVIGIGSSLVTLYCMQEAACRRFRFLTIILPVILLEIGILYGLMGWGFFQRFLPFHLWEGVDVLIRRDIHFITTAMMVARGVMIIGVGGLARWRGGVKCES